jgi:hypothetical protein
MKRYYSIDIDALTYNNLSMMDSTILENIHFLSTDTGWCYASKKSLCKHHNMTTQMYRRYTLKLIDNGWLKTNKKGELKTTKKYLTMGETKVSLDTTTDRNKSFIESETKVSSLPIKKELKREKVTLKEISDYIKDKNLSVDAKLFFDYFEAGNWIDSKGNKVKNWKQKLLTWSSHSNKKQSEQTKNKKVQLWG